MDEYREAFNHFDKDGSGSVSTQELGLAMKELGEEMTLEELTNRVTAVDTDSSGEVDFNEFLTVMGCSKVVIVIGSQCTDTCVHVHTYKTRGVIG